MSNIVIVRYGSSDNEADESKLKSYLQEHQYEHIDDIYKGLGSRQMKFKSNDSLRKDQLDGIKQEIRQLDRTAKVVYYEE